jgi:hypothetical protein
MPRNIIHSRDSPDEITVSTIIKDMYTEIHNMPSNNPIRMDHGRIASVLKIPFENASICSSLSIE